LQPLTSRHQLSLIPEGAYTEEQRERAKRKSDAVQAHFYRLRHVAARRLNQVARLYRAIRESIALVQAGKESLPYDFSYLEPILSGGRQRSTRVDLKLWAPFPFSITRSRAGWAAKGGRLKEGC
jgi:hypothetical protein